MGTINYNFPYIATNQASKEVTMNSALDAIDTQIHTAATTIASETTRAEAAEAALGGSSTLAADTDVTLTSPANNDVLTYETSSSKWKNKPVTTGTLAADTDVYVAAVAQSDVLHYDSGLLKWKNAPIGWYSPSGASILTNDGSSLSGWTTAGIFGGVAPSVSGGVGNPSPSFYFGNTATNNAGYAFINSGGSSFTTGGYEIKFDINFANTGPTAIIHFGADSLGNSPVLFLSSNPGGGSGPTQFTNKSDWASNLGPPSGTGAVAYSFSTATWYTIKIAVAPGGASASWYVNGVLQATGAITTPSGQYVGIMGPDPGYSGSGGAANGFYIDNISVAYSSGEMWTTSRTVTAGKSTLEFIYTGGNTPVMKLPQLPVYSNNAAAVSGGLVAGCLYRTNADPDPVCIVH